MTQLAMSRRAALQSLAILGLAPVVNACTNSSDAASDNVDDNLGFAGVVLGEPLAKPTIAFTDTGGQPYDLGAQTEGQLLLLFFGYTSCPDVCPITLALLDSALSELSGPGADARVVFVGVDNARDTPERMRQYLDDRGEGFVGLNPQVPLDELNATLTSLLLPGVTIAEPEPDGSYVVGHPSQVLVYSPDNTAHIVYQFETKKAEWVKDLPRLATFDWPVTTR